MNLKKLIKRLALLALVLFLIVGVVWFAAPHTAGKFVLALLLTFLGITAIAATLFFIFKFAAKTAGKGKEKPTPETKKGVRHGWLLVLLTLAVVGWFGWKYLNQFGREYLNQSIAATVQTKPPVPTYTLRCGDGTGVVLPGGIQRTAFLVPTGGCDSEYIILPKGYWQMGLHPSGTVEYRNESDKLIGLDSADTKNNSSPEHPRELRIRNLEKEPVVVQATFAY